MLDRMKNLGFKYSTKAGITVGVSDILVLGEKDEILHEAQAKVDNVIKQFRRGLITEEERYDRVISIWSNAKDVIQGKLMKSLNKRNPIFMMSDSGARGKRIELYSACWYAWSDGQSIWSYHRTSNQIKFP